MGYGSTNPNIAARQDRTPKKYVKEDGGAMRERCERTVMQCVVQQIGPHGNGRISAVKMSASREGVNDKHINKRDAIDWTRRNEEGAQVMENASAQGNHQWR